jgi:type II secretory pathway component GspD/PulD (secretin)
MTPTQIAAAVALSVAFAAGGGAAWVVRGYAITGLKNDITKLEADHAKAVLDSERVALTQTSANFSTLGKAQATAASRDQSNRLDSNTASSAVVGLRDANAAALRAARSSLSASTANAEKLSELLDTCSARYTAVATDTDAWENSAITHHDGWPSNAPAK